MFQAYPASWTATPSTMDFTYDAVYNSSFPTLCELDIDNSIHNLFEGLPEIYEPEHSNVHREVFQVDTGVTVASSPLLPSTPPAQGSRPSSMGGAQTLLLNAVHLAGNEQQQQQHHLLMRPELPLPTVRVVGDRRGARNAGKGGHGRVSEPKGAPGPSPRRVVLEALPLPTAVTRVVPKILPAMIEEPVVATLAAHPLHLGSENQRPPKRLRSCIKPEAASTLPSKNTRTQKTLYFDKVEHIVRERWRRDDMAGKFLALETLLPPSTKRDRSTIVEDSMTLVKSLQHRREEALKRREELKQAVLSAKTQSPGVKLSHIIQKIGSLVVMVNPHHSSNSSAQAPPECSGQPLSMSLKSKSTSTGGTKRALELVDGQPESSGAEIKATVVPKLLKDCVHRFYVHSDVSTGDIVIELICEQIPNIHSSLLKSIDSLGLEVTRCSLTKTINRLIYNITVKPFPSSSSVKSTSNIMEGLSSAFGKK